MSEKRTEYSIYDDISIVCYEGFRIRYNHKSIYIYDLNIEKVNEVLKEINAPFRVTKAENGRNL